MGFDGLDREFHIRSRNGHAVVEGCMFDQIQGHAHTVGGLASSFRQDRVADSSHGHSAGARQKSVFPAQRWQFPTAPPGLGGAALARRSRPAARRIPEQNVFELELC